MTPEGALNCHAELKINSQRNKTVISFAILEFPNFIVPEPFTATKSTPGQMEYVERRGLLLVPPNKTEHS